jgi:hypothetical protein
MKTLVIVAILALGARFAHAQLVLDSASVDLTTTGTTTISLLAGGSSGVVNSVACGMTTAITQGGNNVTATIKVKLDGAHTTTYALYTNGIEWDDSLFPFVNAQSNNSYLPGKVYGDTFLLDFDNVAYTNGLSIQVNVSTTGVAAGVITCSALRT